MKKDWFMILLEIVFQFSLRVMIFMPLLNYMIHESKEMDERLFFTAVAVFASQLTDVVRHAVIADKLEKLEEKDKEEKI